MVSTARILQPASPAPAFGNEKEAQAADDPHECPGTEIIQLEHYRRQSAGEGKPDGIVYFPITIDESLSTDAQDILKRSCGDSCSSLSVEALRIKHQSKIWIRMRATAYGLAVHAIILGLPGAEFGPVTHLPALSRL